MRRIYILSNTTLEANNFIYRNNLDPIDYVRIHNPATFSVAFKGVRVIRVGKWEHFRHLTELNRMFVNKCANLIDAEAWLELIEQGESQ